MISSSRWFKLFPLVVFTGLASVVFFSCSSNSYEGMVVAVELAGEAEVFEGASLVVIDPANPEKPARELINDFYGACSPSLNHEGRNLSFQGKQKKNDPWQIWLMDLEKGKVTQVTDLSENCTHPALMPDGTITFSRESTLSGLTVHDLWRCQLDGTGLTRLTFNPASNLHASVLNEGRVLYTSRVQYPDPQEPVLMVMRPDGTKSEIYSYGSYGVSPAGSGAESDEGYIYFIGNGGELSRVLHRRPLHTFENLSAELNGNFSGIVPTESGCLVAYQPSEGEVYGLYQFDPETRATPTLIYKGDKHLTDPVLIAALPERPRILPSAVNPSNATGILMSQDINHSQLPVHSGITGDTIADRIRVMSLEKELGVVEVKADGSFYIKLDSDTPFRIETLNKQGETVRGPSDWIYLRPNERRACVGCHANPELAPRNFQPLAVKEDPVVLSAEKKETSQ